MIAQRMPGRTENSCKNRWFSASRRKWCAENGIDAESPDGKLKYGPPQLRNLPIRECGPLLPVGGWLPGLG
jgi:hypothetical protein